MSYPVISELSVNLIALLWLVANVFHLFLLDLKTTINQMQLLTMRVIILAK